MKTSTKLLLIIVALFLLLTACGSNTTATPQTPAPADSITNESTDQLENPPETVDFRGIQLVKKEIPSWLINAIAEHESASDLIWPEAELTRIIAGHLADEKETESFRINQIQDGKTSLFIGYSRLDKHLFVGETDCYIDAPTVYISKLDQKDRIEIIDEYGFSLVVDIVEALQARNDDRLSFWTHDYEHYVAVGARYENDNFILGGHKNDVQELFLDGKFLSILPDELSEERLDNPNMAYELWGVEKIESSAYSNYMGWSRSPIIADRSGNFLVLFDDCCVRAWRWNWQHDFDGWTTTNVYPILGKDPVVNIEGQYVVSKEDKIIVFDSFQSVMGFGVNETYRISLDNQTFRVFSHKTYDNETGEAYIAVPTQKTIYRITKQGIDQAVCDSIVFSKDGIFVLLGNTFFQAARYINNSWEGIPSNALEDGLHFRGVVDWNSSFMTFTVDPDHSQVGEEDGSIVIRDDCGIKISIQ